MRGISFVIEGWFFQVEGCEERMEKIWEGRSCGSGSTGSGRREDDDDDDDDVQKDFMMKN